LAAVTVAAAMVVASAAQGAISAAAAEEAAAWAASAPAGVDTVTKRVEKNPAEHQVLQFNFLFSSLETIFFL
jgi:hypothetical protein